jgi:L-rhamnose isomerase
MAIGLRRKVRLDSRRANQKITRRFNGVGKQTERVRREARIIAKIKASKGDFAPEVKSWISAQLGKRFAVITDDEIQQLVG